MTTPASESVRKVANPAIVLGQIESAPGQDARRTSRHDVSVREDATRSPRLRVVHVDKEVFDDNLDQPLEVPLQIAELTSHLKRRRDRLQEKENSLNEKIASWQTSMDARGAANSDRERELKLRERQLQSLQFHLLQMQNDVIDSQLSMEGVIEHFENTESDEYMKLALELLRFEVLDRFDYVSKRWEILHSKLENLYAEQPVRKAG
ncbi:hypothetical protein [Mariniblastus fucicola]|uniref:Chromosome partition protein Smc n=1 Tax=Mariniblastus fucicola TaxID=980251 RepID=A0A5B9PGL5_9BACT|nr:hypothetical protein [Mariniblastus fucicola]QEG24749.1 hypothetical protein MFFC18_46710 [Mariniblastus fucicola]